MGNAEAIIGAAIFDLNGLPKEYFTTPEINDATWMQTVFQAVGLQSLLISSLQLQGFRYTLVYGSDYCAVIVKQRACYIALVLQSSDRVTESFLQWSQDLEPHVLRSDPRLQLI